MKGKKELLARTLHHSGALSAIARISKHPAEELRILAYHRIFDLGDEDNFPFDPELVSATVANFRRQMEHVATNFSAVTCADVLTALDGGKALPSRPVLITFDDGHLDNYANAFPVLQQVGIPATIFLSTGYIGSERTFWFDEVSCSLFRAPAGSIAIPGIPQALQLSDVRSRRAAAHTVREHLKSIPDVQRNEQVRYISELLKSTANSADRLYSGAMAWDQVKEMSRSGIEFGSHAVSHPMLTKLDDEALERELLTSKAAIEQAVEKSVDAIAYPDGGEAAFDQRVLAAVRRAGYKMGFGYIPGRNLLANFDRFAAMRLHVERYTSFARFCAMLELPAVFGTK